MNFGVSKHRVKTSQRESKRESSPPDDVSDSVLSGSRNGCRPERKQQEPPEDSLGSVHIRIKYDIIRNMELSRIWDTPMNLPTERKGCA